MALSTLVEGVALLRFTLMFPPVIETALLKLKRTLRPCLPLALRVSGKGALEIVAEPAAAGLVVQTAPLRQPETVPAVLFRKVIFGLARATTTLVYVPAGTAVNDPIKAESLCRRMSSTVGAGLSVKDTEAPVKGVRVMPVTVTSKERMDGVAGGVLATAVKLRIAVPPPPPPTVFGRPLQEEKERTRARKMRTRAFNRSIWAPHGRPDVRVPVPQAGQR